MSDPRIVGIGSKKIQSILKAGPQLNKVRSKSYQSKFVLTDSDSIEQYQRRRQLLMSKMSSHDQMMILRQMKSSSSHQFIARNDEAIPLTYKFMNRQQIYGQKSFKKSDKFSIENFKHYEEDRNLHQADSNDYNQAHSHLSIQAARS